MATDSRGRQQQLEQARQQVSKLQTEISELHQKVAESASFGGELAALRGMLQEKKDELVASRQALQQQREQTESQLAEKSQLLSQLESQFGQSKQQLSQLEQNREGLLAEIDRLKAAAETAGAVDEDVRALQAMLQQTKQDNDSLRQQLAQTRNEFQQLQTSGGASDAASAQKLAAAQAERDKLTADLDVARRQLAEKPSGGNSEELATLQRRFEMAVEDLREVKLQNSELQEQLKAAKAKAASAPKVAASTDGMDWEAQKQRMLAQLEGEVNDGDPEAAETRATIEGTIAITDQVVAEKDREIADLKEMLEQQSGNIGDMAIGAQAIAGMLDQDEFIREERENLKQLQDEWRAKLREAEVEVSVERAKLARDRAELEDRLRQLESSGGGGSIQQDASTSDKKKGRKWLSRLGLADSEESS